MAKNVIDLFTGKSIKVTTKMIREQSNYSSVFAGCGMEEEECSERVKQHIQRIDRFIDKLRKMD